jgi:quercetin dioxygenase-like cupin family protein
VEITAEPHHHLILQNEYVRVFSVEIDPRDATLMHRHHHDYAYVVMGNAQLSNEVQGKPPAKLDVSDGQANYSDGNFAHLVKNVGNTPFRNITVEFLQDAKMRTDANSSDPAPVNIRGGTEKVLFVKDGVRAVEVELQIAAVEGRHHHAGPHLVIALTDLSFRAENPDKSATNMEMKAGEVKWIDGGITHTVTNVGSGPAKLVSFEFQPLSKQ